MQQFVSYANNIAYAAMNIWDIVSHEVEQADLIPNWFDLN